MAKLIIYFSLSGNTKRVAQKIQALTGADIVSLEPQVPYPAGYSNYVPVAQNEFEQRLHPEIKTKLPDLDKYDTIYLGYPTWNGRVPMIFYSLFDKYDFSNKTIVPFTTTGGSNVDESMPYVRELAATSKVTDGFRYNNNDTQLKEFIEQLD